ncbi:MAG: response regulator [Alphaproteobacteria bacterium]|nr:response regulator [Alphaproteobacteria bacterium]
MRQILLITDVDTEPEDLKSALQETGAEVIRPRSPEAGVAAARRTPPDLVVVSVNELSPWMLVRALKQDPGTAEVPVMVFDDRPDRRRKARARKEGAESYDGRPLNAERIVTKVVGLFKDEPARAPLLAIPNPEAVQATRTAGHVLVVDDDPSLAELVSRKLQENFYKVTVCTKGREALKLLGEDESIDVLLLDLTMPGVSGLEVLWRIREKRSSTELPIIMLTGKTHSHDVIGALELGANDYLSKPVDLPIVLARINIHMSLKKANQELREREQLYRLLAENATDVVTRASPDGTWSYVSPASRRLLGYDPQELVGRSAYDLIHPDDFDALAANYDAILDSPDMFTLRYRMQRRDGTWAWFDTTMNALRDPSTGEVSEIHGASRDVTAQVEKQARLTEEMMVRFARIAEFRSGETSGHIQRMSHSCELLARRAGLSSLEAEQIRLAATLHDFGNILIPMDILHKEGRLTEDEFAVIRQGPEMGWELLRDSGMDVLERAATISWYHHEHWDGTGYPRGRRFKAIPIEGRIALICDVFDMATSDRPYRPASSVEDTVAEMVADRGKRFDPTLLDLFLSDLDEIIALRARFPDPR